MRPAIANEQTKLLANGLAGVGNTIFTLMVVAPIAAVLYNPGGVRFSLTVAAIGWTAGTMAWIALHAIARRVLQLLQE